MTTFSEKYIHKTQYYESDQMGVIHHANYVKYMEEARHSFLYKLNIRIVDLEKNGIFMPVLSEKVVYKKAIRYDATVIIECKCKKFNGIKLLFDYLFTDANTGELYAIGETEHGFVDSKFKPIIFMEYFPKESNILKDCVNTQY